MWITPPLKIVPSTFPPVWKLQFGFVHLIGWLSHVKYWTTNTFSLKKMYIKSVFKGIIHHIWLHLSDKWSPSEDQKLKGLQTKNRKLFLIHGYCCAFSNLSAACSFTWAQGTLTSLDSARAGSSRGLLGGGGASKPLWIYNIKSL